MLTQMNQEISSKRKIRPWWIICLLLLNAVSMKAQSPGGISAGLNLWLKADKNVNDVYTLANVSASNRSASSSSLSPTLSVMTSASAWAASTAVSGQYLTLDLGSVQTAYGVATKGRGDVAQWVTQYTISTSVDGTTYTPYGTTFIGNADQNTVVYNQFSGPLSVRYIRIIETAFSSLPAMRADVITGLVTPANGANVTKWNDNAGNPNITQQATKRGTGNILYNSNGINFNPTVDLSGTADTELAGLTTTANEWDGQITIYGIARQNDSGNLAAIFSSQYKSMAYLSNNYYLDGNGCVVAATGAVTTGTSNLILAAYDSNNPTAASQTFLNGQFKSTGGGCGTAPNITFEIGGRTSAIGATPSGTLGNFTGRVMNGSIGEVIVYKALHTGNNLSRLGIESYLAIKYGLTLSNNNNNTGAINEVFSGSMREGDYIASDGTIVWASNNGFPGTTPYHNNVTGIGRDDASSLNQKQSQSQTSNIVTIGLGTITATNSANANLLNDKSFDILGDDGATTQYSTAVAVPTGIKANVRMARVWKLQETGVIGNVQLAIPASYSKGNTVYLVRSTNSAFDATDEFIPMTTTTTINGVSSLAATIDFNNGDYFTFATFSIFPGGVATGLGWWYKGDAGLTTSGTSVTNWINQSLVASLDLVQATATSQPTATKYQNFNQIVTFDGSNDYLRNATGYWKSSIGNTSYNVFGINKSASSNGVNATFGDGTNAGTQTMFTPYNANYYSGMWGGATINIAEANYPVGTPYLWSNRYAPSLQRLRNNGIDVASGVTASSFNGSASPLDIGGYANSSWYFNGDIGEQAMYATDLTATERQRVESYLALKWGVSLNQTTAQNYLASDGTTNMWNAATAGIYKNNIAGIGRDDASGLNQKESQSVSSNVVTIGLGTITATNAANANIFNADKNFESWADDGGAAQFSTPFSGPGAVSVNNRMTRIWKLQETGTIGSVQIAIPSSFSNGNTIYLIRSTDAVFTSADEFIPLTSITVNGSNYYASNIDFNDGDFFTFAAFTVAPGGVNSSLAWWYKGDAGLTKSGSAVTAWANQSLVSALDVVQATVANQPTSTQFQNFNPLVTFDGSNDYLRNTAGYWKNSTANARYNTFVMSKSASSAGTNAVFGERISANGDEQTLFLPAGGNYYSGLWYSGNRVSVAEAGYPIAIPYIWSSRYAPSTNILRNNGINVASNITSAAFNGSNSALDIGGSNTSGWYFNGNIGEEIMYAADLTVTQRQQVESYLALKWGMTLNQTTAYSYLATDGTAFWDAIANATYKNNIAGIGRDDATALNQKQSTSQNAGIQLLMSIGTIAANNATNANVIAADKQFNVWGDDGISGNSAISGFAGTNQRLAKTWKLQQTGGYANATTVYYPAAGLGGWSNVQFLYTTAVTATPTTALAMNAVIVNGISYYSVTLPAGTTYFTFGGFKTNPGGVANQAWWYKGDTGLTTSGTSVTGWADQSGNALDLIQTADINKQPKNTAFQNFNPVVTFDGSDALNNALGFWKNSTNNAAYNVYAMTTHTLGTGSINALFDEGVSTGEQTLLNDYSANTYSGIFSSNYVYTPFTSVFSGVPTLISSRYNSTGSIKTIAFNDRSQTVTSGGATAIFNGSNSNLVIGNYKDQSSWPFLGDIAEIIMYPSDVAASGTNKQKIESYLALKWGTTLDQTTAYNYLNSTGATIWDATSNAAYKYNIAGIGRDDASGLNQKQSNSVNPALQLIIGNGTVLTNTNSANNSSFTDQNFEVWGDNGLTYAMNTAVAGIPGINYRMNRVWQMQETGTVGTVTIAVPANDITFLNQPNLSLLVSNNSSFPSASTITYPVTGIAVVNGVSYLTVSKDFINGQYFTFGDGFDLACPSCCESVTNGDFESTGLSGWTTTGWSKAAIPLVQSPGIYAAINSNDGASNQTLSQPINTAGIPAGGHITAGFDFFVGHSGLYYPSSTGPGIPNWDGVLDIKFGGVLYLRIRNPGDGLIHAELYNGAALRGWQDFRPRSAPVYNIKLLIPYPTSIANPQLEFSYSAGGDDVAIDNVSIKFTSGSSDYGDAPVIYTHPSAYKPCTGAVWAGLLVDTETASYISAGANGDDLNGSDDEDGLAIPASLVPNTTINFPVTVNASVNNTIVEWGLWIDWNSDGVYDDFYSGNGVAGGPVTYIQNVNIPSNASGIFNARLMIKTGSSFTAVDFGSDVDNGEIEDYQGIVISGTACYKPGIVSGSVIPTINGITSLGRAGAEQDNWPMLRQSGQTVLESKTKGFVVNRMPTTSLSGIVAVEGMIVYDTTENCLKIYNGTAWGCFTTAACPD